MVSLADRGGKNERPNRCRRQHETRVARQRTVDTENEEKLVGHVAEQAKKHHLGPMFAFGKWNRASQP